MWTTLHEHGKTFYNKKNYNTELAEKKLQTKQNKIKNYKPSRTKSKTTILSCKEPIFLNMLISSEN